LYSLILYMLTQYADYKIVEMIGGHAFKILIEGNILYDCERK